MSGINSEVYVSESIGEGLEPAPGYVRVGFGGGLLRFSIHVFWLDMEWVYPTHPARVKPVQGGPGVLDAGCKRGAGRLGIENSDKFSPLDFQVWMIIFQLSEGK